MIKTKYLVPEVYYDRSRDFQLMGRTYDVIFNYLKTNADTISNNPLSDDSDNKLINLVSTTLGFKQLHQYNTNQLKAICSIYQLAIKNKGSLNSIKLVVDALLNVNGIDEEAEIEVSNYTLIVKVPSSLTDLTLLNDMLDYILPAGISCNITKQTITRSEAANEFGYEEVESSVNRGNYATAFIPQYQSQVTPSDTGVGRNDNMTVMGYDDNATKPQ